MTRARSSLRFSSVYACPIEIESLYASFIVYVESRSSAIARSPRMRSSACRRRSARPDLPVFISDSRSRSCSNSLISDVNGTSTRRPSFQMASIAWSPGRRSCPVKPRISSKTLLRLNGCSVSLSTRKMIFLLRSSSIRSAGAVACPGRTGGATSSRTSEKFEISRAAPLSRISKSSRVSPATGLPARSVTKTSMLTTSTSIDSTTISSA